MKTKIIISLMLLLILPLISANGLNVVETSIQLNKSNIEDYTFNLTIRNEEPFAFYNITDDNSLTNFNKFNLESGENKTIQITISQNQEFSGDITFYGEYFADLGESNDIYNIQISEDGLDICNIDTVVGDSINWYNSYLSGDVRLRNSNTGEYFAEINAQETYTLNLTEAQTINYAVWRIGVPISSDCTINVNPQEGYVRNSNYDDTINLDLNIIYQPTTLEATFYDTSYTLGYNEEIDNQFFKLENTGNRIAKNIKLESEWLVFEQNNFDLGVGQDINVEYSVKPTGITNTTQTNKTYTNNLSITGNFETITQDFDIFIEYSRITGVDGFLGYDEEIIDEFVKSWIVNNLDKYESFFVSNYNYSSGRTDIEIDTDAWTQTVQAEDSFRQREVQDDNTKNELLSNILNNTEENKNQTKSLSDRLNDLETANNSQSATFWVMLIIMLFGGVSILAYLVYNKYQAKMKLQNYSEGVVKALNG